jgi:hypothetical protein
MDIEVAVHPLADLEAVIERGLTTFVEVGQALLEIRERRLYRESHESFENYCRDRWGFSRSRAHRLMDAAEVGAMLPMGNMPDNERQARELARLKDDPEAVREVWAEVQEATNGRPTAAAVSAVIQRRASDPDFTDDDDDDDEDEDTVADAVADGYVLPPRGLRPARKAWYAALSPSHYERIPPEDVIATAEPKELAQSLGAWAMLSWRLCSEACREAEAEAEEKEDDDQSGIRQSLRRLHRGSSKEWRRDG